MCGNYVHCSRFCFWWYSHPDQTPFFFKRLCVTQIVIQKVIYDNLYYYPNDVVINNGYIFCLTSNLHFWGERDGKRGMCSGKYWHTWWHFQMSKCTDANFSYLNCIFLQTNNNVKSIYILIFSVRILKFCSINIYDFLFYSSEIEIEWLCIQKSVTRSQKNNPLC